jgi:hypothetical protein
MKIGYGNKLLPNFLSFKFLGLTIYRILSWRMHINHLTTKLNNTCYVIRYIKPLMSQKTLLLIYHSLFNTIMSYGIIFWGSSCHSIQIFRMQKRAIRIIMDCGNTDFCSILVKKLKLLPRMSQYIHSLLIFVVDTELSFCINSEIHNINTRQNSNLHMPLANLDIYQKGVYCSCIKIFNSLLSTLKIFPIFWGHLKVL